LTKRFDVIGFDADDTLWHNETFYRQGKQHLIALFSDSVEARTIGSKLDEIEMGNVAYYGYGLKSFALSLVETAVRLSDGDVSADVIDQIIDRIKKTINSDPQHFEHTRSTLEILSKQYTLMLITKGDLFEQERKIARSGLSAYFNYIEVVSEKDPLTYRNVLEKYQINPQSFLMIGNSLRSDILPVIEIGGQAIYIPYDLT
jgi:putative hydrolase of the HAD superfamily